jgi:hypothetical protein
MLGAGMSHLLRSIGACLVLLLTLDRNVGFCEDSVAIEWPSGSPGEALSSIDVRKADQCCGQRSLYTWLRLVGTQVTFDQVAARVPVTDEGTSLAELQHASEYWSAGLTAVRATLNELDRIPLPAIAHIWLNQRSNDPKGHYLVLLSISSESVAYADSATSKVDKMSRQTFASIWSGYLLVRKDAYADWMRRISVFIVIMSLCLCVALWMRRGAIGSRVKLASLLLLMPAVLGCRPTSADNSSFPGTSARSSSVAPLIINTSARSRDLGFIRVGHEARASFAISNVSNQRLKLHLGRASCACIRATLSKDVIEPRESAELVLLLSSSDSVAGSRQGGVMLGTSADATSYLFEAKGIVEGMNTHPYAMRLPTDTTSFTPDPIVGEIILSPDHSEASVTISDVTVARENGESADPIDLQTPELFSLEKFPYYARLRFRIPVVLKAGRQPAVGQYSIRITYHIGTDVADHLVTACVYPRAE